MNGRSPIAASFVLSAAAAVSVVVALATAAGGAACTSAAPAAPNDAAATNDASDDAGDDGGGFPPPDDPLAPSDAPLAQRVARVFGGTCAGIGPESQCHAAAAGGLRLSLAPIADGGDVVGVASTERPDLLRVRPGAPALSYLYAKVDGDASIVGARMPKDAPSFDPRLPALVAAWIDAGAPLP